MAGRIKSCYGKKSRIFTRSIVLVGLSRWTNTQPSRLYNQVKNDTIQGSDNLLNLCMSTEDVLDNAISVVKGIVLVI